MSYRTKLAGVFLATVALAPAVVPAVAWADERVQVEVAGVQAGPGGEVRFVCTFSAATDTEQSCAVPPPPVAAAVTGRAEVAGVVAVPSVEIVQPVVLTVTPAQQIGAVEVAGVQTGRSNVLIACVFNIARGAEQACPITLFPSR